MIGGSGECFDAYDALKDGGGERIVGGCRDDSGAVDQVNPTSEGDVLPDLRLTRNRCYPTHLPALQRVDNAALPNIRITDKTNRYLLLVGV